MTSADIQQHIATITADITAKQQRLSDIPGEKSRSLEDEKSLMRLEKEESDLAAAITRLEGRLPLLWESLEVTSKQEAGGRLRSIQAEWGLLATTVGGDSQKIRQALADLVQLIAGAHQAWGEYLILSEEAAYLVQRYQLPRLAAPDADRIATKEIETVLHQAEALLKASPPAAAEWASQAEDWRAEQSRLLQQRERAHPRPPIMIDHSAAALAEARKRQRELEIAKFGLVRAPAVVTRQGFPDSR